MKYSLSKLLDKKGGKLKNPKPMKEVSLDVSGQKACAFVEERLIGELIIMKFEAHAGGLFLEGVERAGFGSRGEERYRFQEWFLAYPRGKE